VHAGESVSVGDKDDVRFCEIMWAVHGVREKRVGAWCSEMSAWGECCMSECMVQWE